MSVHPSHKMTGSTLAVRKINGAPLMCKVNKCVYCGKEVRDFGGYKVTDEKLKEFCVAAENGIKAGLR